MPSAAAPLGAGAMVMGLGRGTGSLASNLSRGTLLSLAGLWSVVGERTATKRALTVCVCARVGGAAPSPSAVRPPATWTRCRSMRRLWRPKSGACQCDRRRCWKGCRKVRQAAAGRGALWYIYTDAHRRVGRGVGAVSLGGHVTSGLVGLVQFPLQVRAYIIVVAADSLAGPGADAVAAVGG
jgi:hypothetical protein